MIRNYFLINIILLVIVGYLGTRFYKVYSYTYKIPSATAIKQIQKKTHQAGSDETVPDEARFQIISDMDLFRPSRTPYKEDVKQQEVSSRTPPRLFGTIIRGNEKTAILEDPNTKLTRMYHPNESIAGYVISDIFEEKVILSRDGEKSEVKLREEKKGLAPVRTMVAPPPQLQRTQPRTSPQQQQIQTRMPPQQQQIQTRMPTPPVQRQVPQRRPIRSRRFRRNLTGE